MDNMSLIKMILITLGVILLRLAILGATVAFVVWVVVAVCNAIGVVL